MLMRIAPTIAKRHEDQAAFAKLGPVLNCLEAATWAFICITLPRDADSGANLVPLTGLQFGTVNRNDGHTGGCPDPLPILSGDDVLIGLKERMAES